MLNQSPPLPYSDNKRRNLISKIIINSKEPRLFRANPSSEMVLKKIVKVPLPQKVLKLSRTSSNLQEKRSPKLRTRLLITLTPTGNNLQFPMDIEREKSHIY